MVTNRGHPRPPPELAEDVSIILRRNGSRWEGTSFPVANGDIRHHVGIYLCRTCRNPTGKCTCGFGEGRGLLCFYISAGHHL